MRSIALSGGAIGGARALASGSWEALEEMEVGSTPDISIFWSMRGDA